MRFCEVFLAVEQAFCTFRPSEAGPVLSCCPTGLPRWLDPRGEDYAPDTKGKAECCQCGPALPYLRQEGWCGCRLMCADVCCCRAILLCHPCCVSAGQQGLLLNPQVMQLGGKTQQFCALRNMNLCVKAAEVFTGV